MTLNFVVGDRKLIEFQLLMLDPDPPYKPFPIDLDGYDEVKLFAKQVGPRPAIPSTFVPKTFTLTGSFITPHAQGYAGFDFTPVILNTAGQYVCRIKLYNGVTETWSCAHKFYLNVDEF